MKLVQSAPFPTPFGHAGESYNSYRVTAELNDLKVKCQFVPVKGTSPDIHKQYHVKANYESLSDFHKEKKTSKIPKPMVVKLGETQLEILHAVIEHIVIEKPKESAVLTVTWGETAFEIPWQSTALDWENFQQLQEGDAVAFTITQLSLWEQ